MWIVLPSIILSLCWFLNLPVTPLVHYALEASHLREDDHVDAEGRQVLQEVPVALGIAGHHLAGALDHVDLTLQKADDSPEVFRGQILEVLLDEVVDTPVGLVVVEIVVGDSVSLDEAHGQLIGIANVRHDTP